MSEMVERVAKAIYGEDTLAGLGSDVRDTMLERARTVIQAMRQPTEEMRLAGYEGANSDIGGDWIGTVEVQSTIGKTAWHYMIDAALAPTEVHR